MQPSMHHPGQGSFLRHLAVIVGVTVLLLAIPLVAMQFTAEVNWGKEDFGTAALLLIGTGLLYEQAVHKLRTRRARLGAGAVLLLALLIVWAQLAVGIFA